MADSSMTTCTHGWDWRNYGECPACTNDNQKHSAVPIAANELNELRCRSDRLTAMMPLFEEARDALCAISTTAAKLHNVRLDLADRMDVVGDPELWKARQSTDPEVA